MFAKLFTTSIRRAGLLACSFLVFRRTTWPSLVTIEVTLTCTHLFLIAGETGAWHLPFRGVGFNLDWIISNLVVLQCSKCKQKHSVMHSPLHFMWHWHLWAHHVEPNAARMVGPLVGCCVEGRLCWNRLFDVRLSFNGSKYRQKHNVMHSPLHLSCHLYLWAHQS